MHFMICGQKRISDNHPNELGLLQIQKALGVSTLVSVSVSEEKEFAFKVPDIQLKRIHLSLISIA